MCQQLPPTTWLQLNKYEANPYFIQLLQSNTTVCLIIHVFCKSCEHKIIFVLICTLAEQFHVRQSYKTQKSTLSCIGNFDENVAVTDLNIWLAGCCQTESFQTHICAMGLCEDLAHLAPMHGRLDRRCPSSCAQSICSRSIKVGMFVPTYLRIGYVFNCIRCTKRCFQFQSTFQKQM